MDGGGGEGEKVRWDLVLRAYFSLHPWSKELIKGKISLTIVSDSRRVAHLQCLAFSFCCVSIRTGLWIICQIWAKNLSEKMFPYKFIVVHTNKMIFIALTYYSTPQCRARILCEIIFQHFICIVWNLFFMSEYTTLVITHPFYLE